MSEQTETQSKIEAQVNTIARAALDASRKLATVSTDQKNVALEAIAKKLVARTDSLLEANKKDLEAGEQAGLTKALLDRLTFTPERVEKMAEGVRQVIALPDPVGEEIEKLAPANTLDIRKIRVPIGVIGIIYESRPNVTIDCAVLCLKSGNACVLRGGKEAFHSNTALAAIISEALEESGIPTEAVQLIPTVDRYALNCLIKLDQYVHCIIPRGGEGLIRFVAENSTIPVIKHYTGVCNVYLDEAADAALAEQLVVNSKCQRPGVCNAAENLIVHRSVVDSHFVSIAKALHEAGVELRVEDAQVREKLEAAGIPSVATSDDDFGAEYLDLIIAVKVVDTCSEAIDFINTYGSGHSDLIITGNEATAKAFLAGVDASTVYWNASTRFTDGFEFGLGAEIGISTDRLHARGPMGLRELCTYKFVVYGKGQIRT